MGLLRVLLALSVVLSHLGDTKWFSLAGGFASVQMFYIISGFYMATILIEKYDPRKDLGVFYTNRFLRIYSIYFVSLLISLAAYAVIYSAGQGGWWHYVVTNADKLDWPGKLWLGFTSLFIIGQESTLFLEIKNGALAFTPDGPSGNTPVWFFLPVPQAWSISLELMFYALVPFLIRNKSWVLALIAGAALVLRIFIYKLGYQQDPWLSRFFPNEIGLFVMGMLARRFYDAYIPRFDRRTLLMVAGGFLVLTCFVRALMYYLLIVQVIWPYYFLAVIAVPCLFELTRRSKVDQYIGNFSYPLYLIHWIVFNFYDAFVGKYGLPPLGSSWRVAICVIVSFAVSWLIMVSVETPIDRFRQRRVAAFS